MHESFADRLMSEDRKKIQDPQLIIGQLNLHAGMVIADLGCGPGFFTIPLAQKVGATGRIYAVDSNPEMLQHLGRSLKSSSFTEGVVQIMEADVAHTQIPSSSVDLIFFGDILHDLTDRAGFFREVKRISRGGARIVDIDWRREVTEFGPPIEIRLSEEDSRRILTENGFRVVSAISAGIHHYGLICKTRSS